jgi:hypothetical protein
MELSAHAIYFSMGLYVIRDAERSHSITIEKSKIGKLKIGKMKKSADSSSQRIIE